MAEGSHPTPFRTRKLSPPAPMILGVYPWESRSLPEHFLKPMGHKKRDSYRVPFFVPLRLYFLEYPSKNAIGLFLKSQIQFVWDFGG